MPKNIPIFMPLFVLAIMPAIFKSQLSEDEFRRNSDFVIDNGESVDSTLKQIRDYLEG